MSGCDELALGGRSGNRGDGGQGGVDDTWHRRQNRRVWYGPCLAAPKVRAVVVTVQIGNGERPRGNMPLEAPERHFGAP